MAGQVRSGEGRRGGSQRIPRPDDARPGALPPWARLPAERHRNIDVATVRRAVAQRGPEELPVIVMPPAPIGTALVDGAVVEGAVVVAAEGRREPGAPAAAVLCALFDEGGEAHVILTRRSSTMRSHTSEVSFPGGRLEEGEQPRAAALREASEEVGLDPDQIEILGTLPALATFRGEVVITPFVGVLSGRPVLRPCSEEVERAFDVSLAELVSEGVYREELWKVPGDGWRSISFFELEGDTVWGATAWMLRELLELTVGS